MLFFGKLFAPSVKFVDFLKKENNQLNKEDIIKAIAEWSPRKAQQMTDTYVTIALERLSHYENNVLA